MGNAHAQIYMHIYIYIYIFALRYAGMARPAPQRPLPPAVRLATCLRRRPIARMHGQHPSGPDFVFSRRPRAGDRRTGTCACAPRSPGPVRAGLQNNCAPAITGMCIHQHPPYLGSWFRVLAAVNLHLLKFTVNFHSKYNQGQTTSLGN